MRPECYLAGCNREVDGQVFTYADVPSGALSGDGQVVAMYRTEFCLVQLCKVHRDALAAAG